MEKNQKKTDENYIYAYYQGIKDGSIVVGTHVRTIYEKLIRGLEDKEFFFDQKKANNAVSYIETSCFHTEGPLAPGPLKLELWQKAMISAIFGIVDENGLRQFREIVLVVARKNGKSALGSAIGRYIWLKDGGYGAKIYCLAPKLEQADIIYNNIWQMTTLDPEWQQMKELCDEKDEHNKRIHDVSELAKKRQSDLYLASNNSAVKKIAFNAKQSDGFNPSLCVCDEIASWQGDAGLKQYEVMKSGMGARPEGMLLSCSTSGYVNDSIYDELINRSTRFLKGDSKEKRLLPLLYMIDDPDKWDDINELRKSNPNLGVSVSVDYMIDEIEIARGSLSKKAEFMTKYCNVKQNSSMAWFDAQTVMKQFSGDEIDLGRFRNHYCVIGIDLSQTTDLTAVCVVIEKGGKLYTVTKFFMPSEKMTEHEALDSVPYSIYRQRGFLQLSGENYIDYQDCYAFVSSLINDYKIYPLKIGYDRYSAQYLVKSLESIGCQCDDVYQGENLTPVINEVDGMMHDAVFEFGDNDLMKIHLLNAAIKVNNETNRKRLIKIGATNRIDGTAAFLDAMCVRQKWYAEIGEQLKNRGK